MFHRIFDNIYNPFTYIFNVCGGAFWPLGARVPSPSSCTNASSLALLSSATSEEALFVKYIYIYIYIFSCSMLFVCILLILMFSFLFKDNYFRPPQRRPLSTPQPSTSLGGPRPRCRRCCRRCCGWFFRWCGGWCCRWCCRRCCRSDNCMLSCMGCRISHRDNPRPPDYRLSQGPT